MSSDSYDLTAGYGKYLNWFYRKCLEQILKRIKESLRYEAYERKEEERRDLASDYLQVTFSCSMCLWIFVAHLYADI